jgi:hypothetical protein
MQARAQALNAKMEGEARVVLDEIERTLLRTKAKESYKCVVTCFEKAGSTGPSEVLDQCSRNCQVPYQRANAFVQEVSRHKMCLFFFFGVCESVALPGMKNYKVYCVHIISQYMSYGTLIITPIYLIRKRNSFKID